MELSQPILLAKTSTVDKLFFLSDVPIFIRKYIHLNAETNIVRVPDPYLVVGGEKFATLD